MQKPFARFLIRWFVSSLGLWIAAGFISSINFDNRLIGVTLAGLVLAIINTLIKPILVIFALPALVLTLGLFMIVINGLTVLLASKLYPAFHVTSFWAAIFAGMVIGLVNYLVTTILEGNRS